MKKASRYLVFMWMACILMSCQKAALLPGQYIKYVENKENGLKTEKIVGHIKLMAQFKPYDYILLKESKQHVASEDDLQQGKKELKNYYYYTFQIASKDGQGGLIEKNDGTADYYSKLSYCSFGMQNDFLLIDGDDTLRCDMFNFERNYGLAPYNSFTMGFPAKKTADGDLNKTKTLIYVDKIYNLGTVKFRTESKSIMSVPNLKFI